MGTDIFNIFLIGGVVTLYVMSQYSKQKFDSQHLAAYKLVRNSGLYIVLLVVLILIHKYKAHDWWV